MIGGFSAMIQTRLPGIPGNTVGNLAKVFGGADLLNAIVPDDIFKVHLPTINSDAGIIPVPDLERFNPKPPFKGVTAYLWALIHGTTVSGATAILLEGTIRPADWDHNEDPKKCGFPNFGLFAMGQQMPSPWLLIDLIDRASKRGKGQQPILIGALFRGKNPHIALRAGGNDLVQLKVAQRGVATSNEKYTVAHSAHTQVRFVAVTWDTIPTVNDVPSEDSDDADYRSSSRNWQPPDE